MKKIFKFGSLLLGLSLVGGGIATVGINKGTKEVKAGEYAAMSCDFTTAVASSTSYNKEWSYGDFTVFGGANNAAKWGYVKFGAKKANTTDPDKETAAYVISPQIEEQISRIDIVLNASTVGGSCTWSVDVSPNKDFSHAINFDGGALDYKNAGTYSIKDVNAWDPYSYFRINLNITNKTKDNGVVVVSKINFMAQTSGDTPLDYITCDSINVLPGHSVTPEVEFHPITADNTDVSYEIKSGDDVISLTESGEITGLKAGTAVIVITPDDENADPIDVNVTVDSYPTVEVVEIGKKYIMVAGNYEFTGIDSNSGTSAEYSGSPKGTVKLEVVAGAYENTVAFKMGDKFLEYHGSDNKIYTSNAVTAQSSWTVATEGGAGVIVRNVADRERLISMNTSGHKFNCYKNFDQTEVSFIEYVEGVDLVSFAITETLDVKVGLTGTIAVTYNPANASDKTLTWASENEEIATVVGGVVTGVAEGTTTITASKSGLTSQTCVVTVSKIAQHEGSESDPYTVEDAVAVAKGGTDAMKTGKYIKGLVTKFISGASAASCSFWVGDNLEQISADTGAFEAFKLANISTDVFKLIKIGSTVIISGDITLYQNKTAETSEGGTLVYNSYAVANEFAKTWNENMATICAETKADPAGETSNLDLYCEFSVTESSYNSLAADVKVHFLGEGKTGSNATEVEKMIATYDFCMSKYTNLVNFIGREPTASASQLTFVNYNNNDSAVTIIAIVSVVSVTCLGVLVTLKKRKTITK